MRPTAALLTIVLVCVAGCQSPAQKAPTFLKQQTNTNSEILPDIVGQRYMPKRSRQENLRSLALVSSNELEIYVLSVGQADSMLIIGPAPQRRTLLVDAGEQVIGKKGNAEYIHQRVRELTGKTSVDYAILTHFHSDHGGLGPSGDCNDQRGARGTGLIGLLEQREGSFKVGTLFDPGDDDHDYIPTQSTTHCAISELSAKWINSGALGNRQTPSIGSTDIQLGGGITIDFVAVSGRVAKSDEGVMKKIASSNSNPYGEDQPASENDRSIAFFLRKGDFEMFSAGDLTGSKLGEEKTPFTIQHYLGGGSTVYTNVESYLVQNWRKAGRETAVEIYRVSHHGSEHSSNGDIVKALHPQIAIYSTGDNNTYSHPSTAVVDEFCARGVRQFVTSGVASSNWRDGFPLRCGSVVGDDIQILVSGDGSRYSVNGQDFVSRSDAEEAADQWK